VLPGCWTLENFGSDCQVVACSLVQSLGIPTKGSPSWTGVDPILFVIAVFSNISCRFHLAGPGFHIVVHFKL